MRTQQQRAAAFRALHEGEPFVIPNPWDVGSARVLEALGFKALATTSSGFAFTVGRLDGNVTLDQVVGHVSNLTEVTDLPVSVDLENGYGSDPASAANAIKRVAEEAGAVGGSIEDWDRTTGLYDVGRAAERIAAAAGVARSVALPFTPAARPRGPGGPPASAAPQPRPPPPAAPRARTPPGGAPARRPPGGRRPRPAPRPPWRGGGSSPPP